MRTANSQIPWRLVIATRNRLIHGYLGIDTDTLWSIIRSDIPTLLPHLHTLKNSIGMTEKQKLELTWIGKSHLLTLSKSEP